MSARFRWNWRITVSYFLLFAGIVLAVSGIALFIAPSGRVARLSGWKFLGLDKEAWGDLHTVFGYAAIAFGLLHVAFNWHCLLGYLRRRAPLIVVRPELILALLLAVLIAVASLLGWSPVRAFLALGGG
ncbi:DUF4405 domain-containing protein [Candidatus Bipolaricaulota sp. J31]